MSVSPPTNSPPPCSTSWIWAPSRNPASTVTRMRSMTPGSRCAVAAAASATRSMPPPTVSVCPNRITSWTTSSPLCPTRSMRTRARTMSSPAATATAATGTTTPRAMIAASAACAAVTARTPRIARSSSVRRRSWCRSRALWTYWTPTRSCAPPATCRDRTTCTCRWGRSRSTACARATPCTARSARRVRGSAATSVRSSCRCRRSTRSTA